MSIEKLREITGIYDENVLNKLEFYKDFLIKENEKYNLTSITGEEEVYLKHFRDSLLILDYFEFHADSKVVDIGTGAGFPGLVLAIALPHVKFTLVDSLRKRTNFLQMLADSLSLKNVEIIHARAEDLASKPGYRESFDFGVSRAVSQLSVLLEYVIPFLKKDGKLFAYKSSKADEEVSGAENALKVLSSEVTANYRTELSGMERVIIEITKKEVTKKKYPRQAGKPTKNPL